MTDRRPVTKKIVISVSHVFMKGGYTACHDIAQFYDFLLFRLSLHSSLS